MTATAYATDLDCVLNALAETWLNAIDKVNDHGDILGKMEYELQSAPPERVENLSQLIRCQTASQEAWQHVADSMATDILSAIDKTMSTNRYLIILDANRLKYIELL